MVVVVVVVVIVVTFMQCIYSYICETIFLGYNVPAILLLQYHTRDVISYVECFLLLY
jgi:hypothetical protein